MTGLKPTLMMVRRGYNHPSDDPPTL